MRKIPTIFLRDMEDMKHVTAEPNPACAWVFDGEGITTRKYDGTCMLFDVGSTWWARREVKPDKTPPAGFVPVQHDENTGKTMGWEPVAQSAFAKYHAQAVAIGAIVDAWPIMEPVLGATYELVGPKVNGNPERVTEPTLIRHGYRAAPDDAELAGLNRDYEGLRYWLRARPLWEGIVFHHPDGRMAKIKGRDFPQLAN